jgi:non-specific serine/threonine protein kinase
MGQQLLDTIADAVPEYDVVGEAGRGAFGVVWTARHRHLGRDVAIKQLTGAVPDDQIEQFREEARLLARLDHAHVVRVFDYREHEGLRLLIMELLGGGTLDERIRTRRDPTAIVAATIDAARGLAHAHEHGILHRDVKPSNLMFDQRGTLKVTDFGIAVTDRDVAASAVHAQGIVGTPAFLAPEQAAAIIGERAPVVTWAADQYALAATLYTALTGHLTHDATAGALELCAQRALHPARPILHLAPDLPTPLADVVMRALQRDPADRFPSIAAFGLALAQADTGGGGRDGAQRPVRIDVLPLASAPDVDRTTNLSLSTTERHGLVGRNADLEAVKELLGRHRIVTLAAAGGVGKTSLATAVARDADLRTFDEIVTVMLADVPRDGDVVEFVARSLGLGDAADDVAVADRLRGQRTLLVLDNCEHVVASTGRLTAQLVDQCDGLHVLATSREPLGLHQETVYRLQPLDVADDDASTEEVRAAPATRLFVERARRRHEGFALTTANSDAIRTITRRVDGIPLALELASARLRSMSVQEIADRIDHRFRLLTAGDRSLDDRQRTLHGAIAWSFSLLDDIERWATGRLAVFIDGFDLDAAVSVLGHDADVDEFEAVDLVDALVDKSLLQRHEDGDGRSRFRMLESIRDFALDDRPIDELTAARTAHLQHFLTVAQSASPDLAGPRESATRARLRRDLENLVAALEWAASTPDCSTAGLILAASLYYFWPESDINERLAAALEQLVATGNDVEMAAMARVVQARALAQSGRNGEAHDVATAALRMCTSFPDSPTALRARQAHVLVLAYGGKFDEALHASLSVIDEAAAAGNVLVRAEVMSTTAYLECRAGRIDAARSLSGEVVAIYRSIGDLLGLAGELNNAADYSMTCGDFGEASAFLAEAAPLVERLDTPGLTALHLGNVGLLAARCGEPTAAAAAFARALMIGSRSGDRSALMNYLSGYSFAIATSEPERAARMVAVLDSWQRRFGTEPDHSEALLLEEARSELIEALGVDALGAAHARVDDVTPRALARELASHHPKTGPNLDLIRT